MFGIEHFNCVAQIAPAIYTQAQVLCKLSAVVFTGKHATTEAILFCVGKH